MNIPFSLRVRQMWRKPLKKQAFFRHCEDQNKGWGLMNIELYQIDAFASEVFKGNPAAVVPLSDWLPESVMQDIAMENNLSETAYLVPKETRGEYELRWFTPKAEVDLCGHATLASAYAVFNALDEELKCVDFSTRSGWLSVNRHEDGVLAMDFPALDAEPFEDKDLLTALTQALGSRPVEVYRGEDLLAVFGEEDQVRRISARSDLAAVIDRVGSRGLMVTAPAADADVDFVSRFFAPNHGIPEDPVTGSAHCLLAPFWGARLEKKQLEARQLSARGGSLTCLIKGDRVELRGRCVPYMTGTITLPDQD